MKETQPVANTLAIDPPPLTSRREALALMASATIVSATGCCELRGLPKPEIEPDIVALAAQSPFAFLAPRKVNTRGTPTRDCVDVHAHFFNASDVTIKGYLEGPIAHSTPEPLKTLVKL